MASRPRGADGAEVALPQHLFTARGPAGRPDMAYLKLTGRIVRGEPIQIYNMDDMRRDFTYVGDIVEGVSRVMERVPGECGTGARYKAHNIGGSRPVLPCVPVRP